MPIKTSRSISRKPNVDIFPAEIVSVFRLHPVWKRLEVKILTPDYRSSTDTIVLNSREGERLFSRYDSDNPFYLVGKGVSAHYHHGKLVKIDF